MIARIAIVLAACSGPQQTQPSSISICDKSWEPSACLDAGHYFASQRNTERAIVMYDRGCKRRSMDACIAGSKYSLEIAAAACDMGYEPACMDAARFLDGDLARSKTLLETQCKSKPTTCAEAAKILVERNAEPAALALVQHACGLPDQREACSASVQVDFRHESNQLAVARLGCAIDLAESCLRGGGIATADEKRALLSRACKLKLADGCVALGRLISKP